MPSEIRVDKISSTASPYDPVFSTTGGALSHRNLIINGAMNIHQRGGTISYAHDGTQSAYSLDRFKFHTSNIDEWDGTIAQHTMSSADYNTTGFSKALLLTTGTAESAVASNENAYLHTRIEAQNLQHLQYGTASAKSVILSFWIKASVTGTYAVGLYKADSTSRIINKTITISDTNWNKYTLTFSGDTDSGATIANDNGEGFRVNWHLLAGSDYNDGANASWENYTNAGWAGGHAQNGIITTASATFYLTGVQLELGTVATPFEHRSYAEELRRCERYYQQIEAYTMWGSGFARIRASGKAQTMLRLHTPMRDAPDVITFPTVGQSSGQITFLNGEDYPSTHGTINEIWATKDQVGCSGSGFSAIGDASATCWAYAVGNPVFKFQSEL